MKFKSFFLTCFSFVFFINSFSSISNNEVYVNVSSDEISDRLQQSSDETRSLDFAKELEEDLENETFKSLIINKPALDYLASVFYAADYFYLGVNVAGANEYSLLRTKLIPGATVAQNSLSFIPLAPEKTYLNGIKENDKAVLKDNPIYNKRIDKLTLQGKNPILTLNDDTTVADSVFNNSGANKVVCLIDNVNDGTSVKTNVIEINDATGVATTDGVVGLAASTNKIFAAVKQNGGDFGSGNGGFAVLNQKDSKLVPIDATTGTDGNLPVKLSLSHIEVLVDANFAITQAAGGDVDLGDIYWDASLQRLFIGLVDAHRNSTVNPGGVVSVLVGRLDGDKLIIESAINLTQALFSLSQRTDIIGSYYNVLANIISSAFKLKTMKTSTGKNYLIVNGYTGLVATDDWKNRIYALPIVGTTQSDGTSTDVENVGKIAAKTDINHNTVVGNLAGMTLRDDDAAKVGVGALPIPDTVNVEDMFVVNDSVFACVAEDRSDATHEAGIFRSTAIFDSNGNIRAWSPWQRVMGTVDRTYGVGFDINTGNYWYFTDDGVNKNTVKVTQWGKSSAKTGLMGNGLLEILSDEFTQENAGVHQIFNFDEETTGFNTNTKFSMLIGTGYKKIALIESGKHVNDIVNNINAFTPTDQFINNTNVFVIQDEALNNIGPINCCALSRGAAGNTGWVFIAGYNGVVILRKANGDGWNSNPGLSLLDPAGFPGDGTWSFKEIGDFSQVRKLVVRNGFVYVMTVDKLSRFVLNANKFPDVGANNLNNRTVTQPPGYLLDMIVFYRAAGDTRLLVATTQGLFYSDPINDIDGDKTVANAPVWTKVALNSGAGLSNPVTHLSFIDVQKGGYTTDGNLYALSADLSLNLATIYRFDVQDGNINPIPEVAGTDYFYSIGELRTNFLTDGALGYSMLSKHFGKTEFLRRIRMISEQTTIRRFENAVNLDLESSAHNVGVMVQNTASGGWVVPGDWGIRVNE